MLQSCMGNGDIGRGADRMKSTIDCVYCYLKQAVSCMTIKGIDEKEQHRVIYRLMDDIKELDPEDTPALNSTKVLLKTYKMIGIDDPYDQAKKSSNDLALALYPKVKEILSGSQDRLLDALKISVAGNVIDLGINRSFDIEGSLRHSLEDGFSINHYARFREMLAETDQVLFLGDNAGEIVFDKILVEELRALGKQVVYVVKGGPILNDSTMEDALYSGLDQVAKVITTGSRYLGVNLDDASEEFLKEMKEASLVIAKGQANFESLEDEALAAGKTFFLLKIKCESVGDVAEAPFGDVVFLHRQ